MGHYQIPEIQFAAPLATDEVLLVANGDLRQSANEVCWPAQAELELMLTGAFAREGVRVRRAHPYDEKLGHGFIHGQRMGMKVFESVHPDAPLVVAESVWQYSSHLLAGLLSHRGPILVVANWSGQWPGLVGVLNLNGCLRKAGVNFSTLWSKDFTDEFFLNGLRQWIREKKVTHDLSHVRPFDPAAAGAGERARGEALAAELRHRKALMGIFDEGCMGMYNAIVEDNLLNSAGIFKERLSQSALYAAMQTVTDSEARKVRQWLDEKGMRFLTGTDEGTELTDAQILGQCKMYIAAMRMAAEFGCDAVGIQYQQGLKDLAPASDLAEGLLNNVDRPPVYSDQGQELYAGKALPHFNEVDGPVGHLPVVVLHVGDVPDHFCTGPERAGRKYQDRRIAAGDGHHRRRGADAADGHSQPGRRFNRCCVSGSAGGLFLCYALCLLGMPREARIPKLQHFLNVVSRSEASRKSRTLGMQDLELRVARNGACSIQN